MIPVSGREMERQIPESFYVLETFSFFVLQNLIIIVPFFSVVLACFLKIYGRSLRVKKIRACLSNKLQIFFLVLHCYNFG